MASIDPSQPGLSRGYRSASGDSRPRQPTDTIAAVATAAGPGGIGIVRVSGPRAWEVGKMLFRPTAGALPDPLPLRKLIYGHICDPHSGESVDEVLCVFFKAPHTYTTEDSLEIQGHGGLIACQRILSLTLAQGCRMARPGEFTQRAFLGGRLDLSQAEAVAQMVTAQSDTEARLALGALNGGLSQRLEPVRRVLLKSAAAIEAAIDYPDDVEDTAGPELALFLEQEVADPLRCLIQERKQKRVYREGAVVVLCGPPNAGKSSLFNVLLGQERAIVTQVPGTTRDSIEEATLLGGVVCRLVDTAGLSETLDQVENLGMEATRRRLRQADLALVVLDGSKELNLADRNALAQAADLPHLITVNKADLAPVWDIDQLGRQAEQALRISALKGMGLNELANRLGAILAQGRPEPAPGEVVVSARQAQSLNRCLEYVKAAAFGLGHDPVQPELVSLDLGEALQALGEVDGLGAPDEVIDTVFRNFCVGK